MREPFIFEGGLSRYHSIVVVGKSAQPLWCWETWRQLVPVVTPLLMACRDTINVESVQEFAGTDQPVCFGGLGWDIKSHLKWTHGSPLNRDEAAGWVFRHTEIWAPDLETCSREEIPPNLFISIENPFPSRQPKPGQFNQFVHLAVEETFCYIYNDVVRQAVQHVASLIDSVLILVQTAPWVSDDECVDCLTNRLRYDEMHEDLVPDLSKMQSNWMLYDPGVPLSP